MKNYVCGICKKQHDSLDAYMECVSKCGETLKAEQKAEAEKERLAKLNADLNKIKEAKKYYDGLLENFKEEYPEEYKLNFGEKHNCSKGTCKCSDNKSKPDVKTETIELSYKDNGKDKPKMSAKVNGKDVTDESLAALFDDPDCRYIAKMLGLI